MVGVEGTRGGSDGQWVWHGVGGIDAGKAQRDIAVRPSGEQGVVGYDATGIAALRERLHAQHPVPALVVLKATGGREIAVAATLLARFAEAVRSAPRLLPDAAALEFAALLARRRQLVGMQTAEPQRRDTALPAVQPHILRYLARLDQELADLDRLRRERVEASPMWRARRPA